MQYAFEFASSPHACVETRGGNVRVAKASSNRNREENLHRRNKFTPNFARLVCARAEHRVIRGDSACVIGADSKFLERERGTAVRQQGRDLAKKLSVTPTPPADFGMAKDHAAAIAKLKSLHGAAFDRAFLAHEAAFHKAVLDAVTTTLMPALQNEEVKDLVTKVAPAFNAHMVKAQTMLASYPK